VRTGGWAAAGIRLVTGSTVNHAGVYVGNGLIVEAEPNGAVLSHSRNYPDAIWSRLDLTPKQRDAIAAAARAKVGTPYSWTDCAAIGLAKILGHALPPFVRSRLSRPDRLMCSQLTDLCYHEAGVDLFADGRLPGDVSPGDLYDLIKASP
jgi:cell wall-associated NlpC family hydrolase